MKYGASSRQPRQHGAARAAQRLSRLRRAASLQVAKDDHAAILFRQAAHLGIEMPPQFVVALRAGGNIDFRQRPLDLLPAGTALARSHGDAKNDLMQPGRQSRPMANRCGLARQREKCRLKSILGIDTIAQPAAR